MASVRSARHYPHAVEQAADIRFGVLAELRFVVDHDRETTADKLHRNLKRESYSHTDGDTEALSFALIGSPRVWT